MIYWRDKGRSHREKPLRRHKMDSKPETALNRTILKAVNSPGLHTTCHPSMGRSTEPLMVTQNFLVGQVICTYMTSFDLYRGPMIYKTKPKILYPQYYSIYNMTN